MEQDAASGILSTPRTRIVGGQWPSNYISYKVMNRMFITIYGTITRSQRKIM